MTLFLGAQFLLLLFLVFIVASYLRNHRQHMPLISSLGWAEVEDGVLIVVPAKDEEDGVSACLERLTALHGLKNFKVIAVDDRSQDQTAAKMRAASATSNGRVAALSIHHLPPGWLGKNHACWHGAQAGLRAMPEAKYILFTDGDVKFHPDILAESITWMRTENIDFMTMLEHAEYEGLLEPAYLLLFGIFIVFFTARPWLLSRPRGRNFMGNGAFLLVRTDAYLQTEAHKTLRLEVVEDMRMGLLMRARGFRCATAVGLGRMWRRWQPGFRGIFKGLLKNAFAGFEYNIALTIVGMAFFPFVFLGPWICLFTGHFIIGLANLLMVAVCFILGSQSSQIPWFTSFLLSPFTSLAASANLATSAVLTLRNGGVSWRGTLYPLRDLRAHCLTIHKAFTKDPA